MRTVTILGATGSIGDSTLDVVARHPDRYRVHALTAMNRVERLLEQCLRFHPRVAVIGQADLLPALERGLRAAGLSTEAATGEEALAAVAAAPEVDCVMAAIVGAAGLAPTLAAARAGKRVLLANKESLVMAGQVFLEACRVNGATVLPIDSEHNAVFQCLPAADSAAARAPRSIRRILLTASGGPFRRASMAEMAEATPDQACAHPKWSMGRKISVDSATMMNKGLELIEAHYLFDVAEGSLDVVVHPQSIIHSLVEYVDGSMLAQLGNPDMRTPISHALAYPERIPSGVAALDLAAVGRLEFEAPDDVRFPCLRLARQALRAGGAAPCALNAANEVAVEAFLARRIRFTEIAAINEAVLDRLGTQALPAELGAIIDLDDRARGDARRQVSRMAS